MNQLFAFLSGNQWAFGSTVALVLLGFAEARFERAAISVCLYQLAFGSW
jgi:hypothetical protein